MNYDRFAPETSFELESGTQSVIQSGAGGFRQDNTTVSATLMNDVYAFRIRDTYGDGICCGWGKGNYSLFAQGDLLIERSGDFGAWDTVCIEVNGGATTIIKAINSTETDSGEPDCNDIT